MWHGRTSTHPSRRRSSRSLQQRNFQRQCRKVAKSHVSVSRWLHMYQRRYIVVYKPRHKESLATGTMVHTENIKTLFCIVEGPTESKPNSYCMKCFCCTTRMERSRKCLLEDRSLLGQDPLLNRLVWCRFRRSVAHTPTRPVGFWGTRLVQTMMLCCNKIRRAHTINALKDKRHTIAQKASRSGSKTTIS